MATETQKPNSTLAEDPKKTLTTAPSEAGPQLSTAAEQQSSESPPVSDDAGTDAAKSDADDPNSKGMNGGGPAVLPHGAALPADVQKKVKRAERFGVPVKLSEEEKRNSRAERFGTGSGANASKGFGTGSGTDASKGAEEQKRKARAERFGLAAQSAGDEDGKKKARLDRFAPVTKVDPLEEEKRKARALRFTQPAVKSNGNGKESVESLSNTAIVGKAGEEV